MSALVFIGYAEEDLVIAQTISRHLETAGVGCWLVSRDAQPGLAVESACAQALSTARLMLLVFSRHSNASPQLVQQARLAFGRNLPVIGFRVERTFPSAGLEFYLNSVQCVDVLTTSWETHLPKLQAAVCGFLLTHQTPVITNLAKRAVGGQTSPSPNASLNPPIESEGWRYQRNGRWIGPVSHAVLCDLVAAGCLSPTDLVRHERAEYAQPASAIPSLAPVLAGAPSGQARLILSWKGRWSLIDVQVAIFLDEQMLGKGSFNQGFLFSTEVSLGARTLRWKQAWMQQKVDLPLSTPGEYLLIFTFDPVTGGLQVGSFQCVNPHLKPAPGPINFA